MKYLKLYQSSNTEYLKMALKYLRENCIDSARLNEKNPQILEVFEEQYQKAKDVLTDDQDIFMSTLDVVIDEQFSPKYEEEYVRLSNEYKGELAKTTPTLDSFKYVFIVLLWGMSYCIALVLNVVIPLEEEKPLTELNPIAIWILIIAIISYLFMLIRISRLKIQAKERPEKKDQIELMRQNIRKIIWLFWPLAFLISYLFFSKNIPAWEGLFSGNEELMINGLSFLTLIIFIISGLYVLKMELDHDPDQRL